MNIERIWTIFVARNCEFYRDRSGFYWNLLFPFLIVAGFGILFGEESYTGFKIGILKESSQQEKIVIPEIFRQTKHLKFITVSDIDDGLFKLRHHKIDFLVRSGEASIDYWINETSPNGYIAEQLFIASVHPSLDSTLYRRNSVNEEGGDYFSFLFPGILGMNMMFSALYGIGYVIVLYRKNGVLKRLKATPLTAFEYLVLI